MSINTARPFRSKPLRARVKAKNSEGQLFRNDPNFRDHPLFYEYFHGDTGRGLGASHQTGWSGLIALLLRPRPCAGAGVLPAVAEPEFVA
jgi:hypothetical protein